ncbi:uncharacterized protein LOC131214288 [Anopheles bellator]|uniref:uncharacterized protein LOC131214288 n=1 Tax=Anopheles bellator TaxID=139047 RepID=UPI00264869DB|nr:uncharacterized protein LOC131214288 [Anopheles bellator]
MTTEDRSNEAIRTFVEIGRIPDFVKGLPVFDGKPTELLNWFTEVYEIFEIFFILATPVISQKITIDRINEPILAFDKGIGRIQIGTKYYIHHFNISRWKEIVYNITRDFTSIPQNQFTSIIQERLDEIDQSVNFLQNRRSKRWDSIGTVWKFIAGNPDANDLKMINGSINDLVRNNNMQVKFNFDLNIRIQEALQKTTQALSMFNKKSIELRAVNIYLHINYFARYLDRIVDTVTLAKAGILNEKILSQQELAIILSDFDQEHIHANTIAEAMSFTSVTILTNSHELALLIKMPRLDPRNFTKTLVFPILQNNCTALHLPERMHLSHIDKNYIVKTLDITIYKKVDIRNDTSPCSANLLKGNTAECDYISNPTCEEIITIDNRHILLNTVGNFGLSSTCGIPDRNLSGPFLITYEDCQLYVNKTLMSDEVQHLPANPIHLQLDGITVNKKKELLNISIDYLHQFHLETRKELDLIHLENNSVKWPHVSIFGGITAIPVIITIVIVFVICHQRRIAIAIHAEPEPPRQTTVQEAATLMTSTPREQTLRNILRVEPQL